MTEAKGKEGTTTMDKVLDGSEILNVDLDVLTDIEEPIDLIANAIDSEINTIRPWCEGINIKVTSISVVCGGRTSRQLHSGKEFKEWFSTVHGK